MAYDTLSNLSDDDLVAADFEDSDSQSASDEEQADVQVAEQVQQTVQKRLKERGWSPTSRGTTLLELPAEIVRLIIKDVSSSLMATTHQPRNSTDLAYTRLPTPTT